MTGFYCGLMMDIIHRFMKHMNELNTMIERKTLREEEQTMYMQIGSGEELRTLYIPFVKHGGFFIARSDTGKYNLGDTITLRLIFSETLTELVISGHVIWISPTGAQASWPTNGIGIQLREEDRSTHAKIETLLEELE